METKCCKSSSDQSGGETSHTGSRCVSRDGTTWTTEPLAASSRKEGMVDFGTNFHRLILLVVELAILLDLRAVVLLVFLV
ncbi:hypothetical protein T12_9499 [Trichinella patagoniensis]|uniref:Transmembrane protein n=1 Tax=Trichinella patagoniensis TaxID=990121 RepID=A0A0V0ZQE2_9BILA|nr:hypothetical protein T12_9499 [Trichinella patagoniensis]